MRSPTVGSRHVDPDWNNYHNGLIESPFKLRQSINNRFNELRGSKESWQDNNQSLCGSLDATTKNRAGNYP
jgi:hypothetical protein